MLRIFTFLIVLLAIQANSQSLRRDNGARDNRSSTYLIQAARIVVDSGTFYEPGEMLVQNGTVIAVGKSVTSKYPVIRLKYPDAWIYPAFIDLYTNYGLQTAQAPASGRNRSDLSGPQLDPARQGPFGFNDAIKAHNQASLFFQPDSEQAKKLRQMGIAVVHLVPQDGIARGTSALVSLANQVGEEVLMRDKVSAAFSFNKGSSRQIYPTSLMGSVALLRQSLYDAQWWKSSKPDGLYDISLQSLSQAFDMPWTMLAQDKWDNLRAAKIATEFLIKPWIMASGFEYQYIQETKQAANAFYILPLTFPAPLDVEDPLDAENVSTEYLKHWELAVTNPIAFAKERIPFSLSSFGLESQDNFWKNNRKVIKAGLSSEQWLAAWTITPAKQLGFEKQLGALKPGYFAYFNITSGPLADAKTQILENWIGSDRLVFKSIDSVDYRGVYQNDKLKISIGGTRWDQEWKIFYKDSLSKAVQVTTKPEAWLINPASADSSLAGWGTLSLKWQLGQLEGYAFKSDGSREFIQLKKISAVTEKTGKKAEKDTANNLAKAQIWFPFTDYGRETLPKQEIVLIKNATVWNNIDSIPLQNTDVLIGNGKILAVGKKLQPSQFLSKDQKFKEIDASGKHLTPGIIDEHSHIAISKGVNESAHSIGSEVRIGDVIRPNDINVYRQLAGGVTAAQLLHGSANTIGGQSALIKLKWGLGPEAFKIDKAEGFIKFALGENVKQSNWGERETVRFPQTRMGVEQVLMDAFSRAKEYKVLWNQYKMGQIKVRPRQDLTLEALVEILDSKRFITCHSYVQSEINMLMKVAEKQGFRVNTFTHILEGYKLADKLKAHGAGASTFSDWWAYKYEVMEAIPFNAALLHRMGVTTAVNSDDAEMGRRLNQEAAKAIKYGKLSESEALKLVTLNPAKLLHLDHRLGYIKAGYDADVVLWDGNPLSVGSQALITWIEATPYFDRAEDANLNQRNLEERRRIIKLMKVARQAGEKTQPVVPVIEHDYHCDTEEID